MLFFPYKESTEKNNDQNELLLLYQQNIKNNGQKELKLLKVRGNDQLNTVNMILRNINNSTFLNTMWSSNRNKKNDRKTIQKETYKVALTKAKKAKKIFLEIKQKDNSENQDYTNMAKKKISEINELINTIKCELSWCTCCGKPCCIL